MHLRNKFYLLLVASLVCVLIGVAAAQTSQSQQSSQGTYDVPSPDPQPANNTQPAPATAPANNVPAGNNPAQVPTGDVNHPAPPAPNQPTDTVRVPTQAQNPEQTAGGGYLFKKQVQEVFLHASVVDDRNRLVTSLD